MKRERGFVLFVSTIMLMLTTILMLSALEAFIMEKKINEAHYQKMQLFYRAEVRLQERHHPDSGSRLSESATGSLRVPRGSKAFPWRQRRVA
jgi:Tfp pilus assembly protein PilX